jgi:hypothetical protein
MLGKLKKAIKLIWRRLETKDLQYFYLECKLI